MTSFAIQGLLEWGFIAVLAGLVFLVSVFALYLLVQVIRNPGRDPDRRRI